MAVSQADCIRKQNKRKFLLMISNVCYLAEAMIVLDVVVAFYVVLMNRCIRFVLGTSLFACFALNGIASDIQRRRLEHLETIILTRQNGCDSAFSEYNQLKRCVDQWEEDKKLNSPQRFREIEARWSDSRVDSFECFISSAWDIIFSKLKPVSFVDLEPQNQDKLLRESIDGCLGRIVRGVSYNLLGLTNVFCPWKAREEAEAKRVFPPNWMPEMAYEILLNIASEKFNILQYQLEGYFLYLPEVHPEGSLYMKSTRFYQGLEGYFNSEDHGAALREINATKLNWAVFRNLPYLFDQVSHYIFEHAQFIPTDPTETDCSVYYRLLFDLDPYLLETKNGLLIANSLSTDDEYEKAFKELDVFSNYSERATNLPDLFKCKFADICQVCSEEFNKKLTQLLQNSDASSYDHEPADVGEEESASETATIFSPIPDGEADPDEASESTTVWLHQEEAEKSAVINDSDNREVPEEIPQGTSYKSDPSEIKDDGLAQHTSRTLHQVTQGKKTPSEISGTMDDADNDTDPEESNDDDD